MKELLAIIGGSAVAVMIMANGVLGNYAGSIFSTAIIHVVGLCVISAAMLVKRARFSSLRGTSVFVLLSGTYGVVSTVLNIVALNYVGAGVMMAATLTTQAICSMCVDTWGLFGRKKIKVTKQKLIGLAVVLSGTALMCVGDLAVMGILASAGAAAALVLNRLGNALMGERVGIVQSTFMNYATGLAASLLCCLILSEWTVAPGAPVYAFSGGAIGVFVVGLTTWLTPRMPVVKTTVLMFSSQMVTALAFDFSPVKAAGCVLMIVGAIIMESGKKSGKESGKESGKND